MKETKLLTSISIELFTIIFWISAILNDQNSEKRNTTFNIHVSMLNNLLRMLINDDLECREQTLAKTPFNHCYRNCPLDRSAFYML